MLNRKLRIMQCANFNYRNKAVNWLIKTSVVQLPHHLCSASQFNTSTTQAPSQKPPNSKMAKVHFPAESDRHERTFMCWPGSTYIWESKKMLNAVQRDVSGIAAAIVNFEPVTLIVSPQHSETVRDRVTSKVDLLTLPVDDLWARDTLPVFTVKESQGQRNAVGVDFNFNGWGGKGHRYAQDSVLAGNLLQNLKIPRENSSLTTEGGALETDGAGTLLVTESSLINENRNPAKTKIQIEDELKRVLGVTKVIWFKGVKGQDITDAHVDCLVRFVRPGRVIVNRPCPGHKNSKEDVWTKSSAQALEVLGRETDAEGRNFEIVELFEPNFEKIKIVGDPNTFVASYANFYVANGVVVLPKFGDEEADEAAQNVLRKEFPGREIVAVEISALASGGGGIHCSTHDLPYIAPN